MRIELVSSIPDKSPPVSRGETISLPEGLVGFPDFSRFDLVCTEDYWPFHFLQPIENRDLSLLVLEPGGWVEGYVRKLRMQRWVGLISSIRGMR